MAVAAPEPLTGTYPPAKAKKFYREFDKDRNRSRAARVAKVSKVTTYRWDKKIADGEWIVDPRTNDQIAPEKRYIHSPDRMGPRPLDQLCKEATRALEDFGYFQRRYFGCISTPWQEEAAYEVVGYLENPEKDYLAINAPPGGGKSTVFTLHVPAWITARDRATRGLLGTLRMTTARWYLRRLKLYLETPEPLQPEPADIDKGLAVAAEAALSTDFGTFRPEGRDTWSQDAIVVAQHGGVATTQKEPTWTAYGMDSGFLGMRFGVIFWDDLVDPYQINTAESRAKQRKWWDDVAERRLEPGGLMVLQGQRMGPDDLYRYCLDKLLPADEDDETEEPSERRMYHHIVFKAHYEDRCVGKHRKDAPYYPEGCMLDPRRVSWIDQGAAKAAGNYETIYQQQDADPASVLVNPLWVKGGQDPLTGVEYPGCWDNDRGLCELPQGLAGNLLSYVTVDPSPTKFWAIEWWIARCDEGQAFERYLMDIERRKMDAASFLDWDNPRQCFTGIMDDWQERSARLNHPIAYWIVERNGAQRFLLQYEHVRRWTAHHRVSILPHDTAANKADPDYGVQTLAGIWKHGLVRLPGKHPARFECQRFVEEATHWPDWSTDDCVMSQWMGEYNLPRIIPQPGKLPKANRPSWLKRTNTHEWATMWRKGA